MKLYKQKDDYICLGLPIDQWLREIQDQVGIKVDDGFSLLKYFVDNFSANYEIWKTLEPALDKVRVGLLTDQYPGMLDEIINAKLFPDIKWESIIDSSVEKVRKPMSEIYELAQKKAGVPDSEILFIDNREKNLAPARDRGWQTFLYDSRNYDQANKDLSEYLKTITF